MKNPVRVTSFIRNRRVRARIYGRPRARPVAWWLAAIRLYAPSCIEAS